MPLEKSSLDDTWERWQAPESPRVRLLTRPELITELERYHVHPPVDVADLRYWEYWGVLPRPVHQGDGKGGRAAARYPIWMVSLIMALRHLQADGVALEEMRPLLQIEARRVSNPPEDSRLRTVGLPPPPRIHKRYPLTPEVVANLDPEQKQTVAMLAEMLIDSIVTPYEHGPGPYEVRVSAEESLPFAITKAEMTLTDERGRRVTFLLPVEYERVVSEGGPVSSAHLGTDPGSK